MFPKRGRHVKVGFLLLLYSNSLCSRIAGCKVPKPRCLSPPVSSLSSRIAGCQVSRCLSPAATSLCSRIGGCQVPNPCP